MNTLKAIYSDYRYLQLFGPFTLLALIVGAFLKGSQTIFIPLAAASGSFLCWQWQLRGLAAAIIMLAVAGAYEFDASLDLYWYLGNLLSFTLSLLIITLSKETTQPKTATPIALSDPPAQTAPVENPASSEEWRQRITLLEENVIKTLQQQIHYLPIVETLQTSLETIQNTHQMLSQEYLALRQELIQAREENADLQQKLQAQIDASLEIQQKDEANLRQLKVEVSLREALEQKYQDLVKQQSALQQLEVEMQKKIEQNTDLQQQNQALSQHNHALTLNLQSSEDLTKQYQQQLTELQAKAKAEAVTPPEVKSENSEGQAELIRSLNRTQRIIEGKLKEVKMQFAEKSAQLDEARKQLFHAEEKLNHDERLRQEKEIYQDPEFIAINRHLQEIETVFEHKEKAYQYEINALNEVITALMKETEHS